MYKPLQIEDPKIVTQKNPVKSALQIQAPRGKLPSNTKYNKAKTVDFLSTINLAQSILKRKFPSVDKPLQKSLWKI